MESLDVLVQVMDELQQRARKDCELFSISELQTRYALIDPLLTALGWDTDNPDKVRVEHRVGSVRKKRVDYVLFVGRGQNRQAVAFIEAKKYGKCWPPKSYLDAVRQVAKYRRISKESYRNDKVPLVIVTDGSAWYIYHRLNEPVSIKNKEPIWFDIISSDPINPIPPAQLRENAQKAIKLAPENISRLAALE